jgi:hypothetical protein
MSEPHQRSGSFFIGPGEDTASQTFTVLADRIPHDLGSARLIWTLSGRLEDVENTA